MATLLLAVTLMFKVFALGAGIGAGIAAVVWFARRAEQLEVTNTPAGQLGADLDNGTRRVILAQDRFRRAEGQSFPQGVA